MTPLELVSAVRSLGAELLIRDGELRIRKPKVTPPELDSLLTLIREDREAVKAVLDDFPPCPCGSRIFRKTPAGSVCLACNPPDLPAGVPAGPICIKCHRAVPPEDLFCSECFSRTRMGRRTA